MQYYTDWFNDIEELGRFLNEKNIQQSNIVQIYADAHFHYIIYLK